MPPLPSRARLPSARRLLPALVSLGILVLVVVVVKPQELGTALSHLNPAYLPFVLTLAMSYYILKGWQWHLFMKRLCNSKRL
ncbi:MAG: hypothetical protein ACYCX9_11430 [Candidatus Dormibacteria bacterium]|jgi:hypothetical protein